MAYTKKLATIVVNTQGGTFTLEDTLECPVATSVLATFKKHGDAYIATEEDTYWVPFNAVNSIKISYTDSEEIEPTTDC